MSLRVTTNYTGAIFLNSKDATVASSSGKMSYKLNLGRDDKEYGDRIYFIQY